MNSISDGYIAIFVLSNIKVNGNNNEIVSFLNEAKYKVKTLNTGISEYIFDVLSNEERIFK
ncbi:MAG: hypothetical protein IJZ46_02790 [Bacilli bacterium]|nr:hypothetical protein [Bacilli bacterium]